MSDLNDFFAKKDRKKKRAGTKSSQPMVTSQHEKSSQGSSVGKSDGASRGTGSSHQPNASDDGWIEIEDPRGSQVHTGGRTVVEMKRDGEEKDVTGENSAHAERFSGWGKSVPATESEEEPVVEVKAPSPAAFPSLADAAKVPTLVPEQKPSGTAYMPPSRSRSGFGSSSSTDSRPSVSGNRPRPKFNIDTEKLRRNLAERSTTPAPGSQ